MKQRQKQGSVLNNKLNMGERAIDYLLFNNLITISFIPVTTVAPDKFSGSDKK